jgi:glycosyltransferase involved in cell wall biosynthesis
VVYDCIDDVTRNARGVAADYAATEQALLARAELALATSSALQSDKSRANRHIHLAPPGCNAEHFAAPVQEAADIAGLAHPRLCFFGGIDERLDLALLATLAQRRPDWTIVLLGVVRTDISPLRGLQNIVYIGQQPYQALPHYVQHMDVLLLPYLLNDYTRRIYPAKVFECLATGKPVVATTLPDLQHLAGPLRILQPHDDAVAVIEQALRDDSAGAAAARQAIARANSWDARFEQMQGLLLAALQAKDNRA